VHERSGSHPGPLVDPDAEPVGDGRVPPAPDHVSERPPDVGADRGQPPADVEQWTGAPAAEPEPEGEPPRARSPWVARVPLILVGLTVVFNLWALHPNAYTTTYANDSSVHVSMARWAEMRISEGHLPFDGWFPYLDLGSSRFHHYQALPAILTGAAGAVVGTEGAFHWLTYLLIALWPICIYFSTRLLEWEPWVAAIAAVVSPLIVSQPSLGYEWTSYTWGGYGLYTQLWGMWLLPFSWALTWRAVSGRGRYWPAALVTALTIGAHLLTGYLALLVIGVWVLIRPSQFLRRVGRAALVGAGALLGAAWMLVPLLTDAKWTTQDPFSRGNPAYDSFGAWKILSWLVSGAIFDNKRIPIVTVLAGIGLIVCCVRWRRDERARAVVAAGTLSMLLFFGRPTWGAALKVLPGSGDLFLRRYIFGVHLAGIVLAGVGAVWAGGAVRRFALRVREHAAGRWRPVVATGLVVVLALALIGPAFADRGVYAARQFAWVGVQRNAEATDGADVRTLVDKAESLGPGRLFAGQGASWGHGYMVGFVPLDIEMLYSLTDAVGFNRPTWSLSSSVTHFFDSADPAQYQLFDVRYIIEPSTATPLVPATRVMERGRYVLYEVHRATGYFDVVDAIAPIEADRTDLGTQMQSFLRSALIGEGRYPTVAFAGAPGAPPTLRAGQSASGPAGKVLSEVDDPDDGRFQATVRLNRRAMVVLRESFDPRWRVTVDGRTVAPQMLAPSFVGREMGPGRHVIAIEYVPYPAYWLLFLISIGSIVGLALLDRRRRRRRSPSSVGDPAASVEEGAGAVPEAQPPASTAAPTAPE
jgi:hypothetical protein